MKFMGVSFVPTPTDVERYRRLRALGRVLSERIFHTVPARAYEEIGDAIGVRRNGVLVFESEHMASVMSDCCIYDWLQDGKNVVQRYVEAHPAKPGTDEAYLLAAYSQAKYGLLTIQKGVLDAGIYCHDVLNREELFIMDQAFSRSLMNGGVALATRTVCLGDYSMTGGAALPIMSADIEPILLAIDHAVTVESCDGPSVIPTAIARACLKAGAAEYVEYADTEYTDTVVRRKERPRMPSWPGSKRRRRLN
jgi:hypothetical protein